MPLGKAKAVKRSTLAGSTTCSRQSGPASASRLRTLSAPAGSNQLPSVRSPHLAFALRSVEGAEADVLAGATNTIRRDRPVFVVEANLQKQRELKFLLGVIHQLNYTVHLVPEQCGGFTGQRNLIAIPAERPPLGWVSAIIDAGSVPLDDEFLAGIAPNCEFNNRGHTCLPSWWKRRRQSSTWSHTRVNYTSHCHLLDSPLVSLC